MTVISFLSESINGTVGTTSATKIRCWPHTVVYPQIFNTVGAKIGCEYLVPHVSVLSIGD